MEYIFERETQFLQFTPLSFIDKVIDLANRHAHAALDRLQDFVDEQIGECPENERGMQMAATLLEALVDKNFDRWELYCLQKVFSLPPSVRLPLAPGLPMELPGISVDRVISEDEDKEMDRQLEFYHRQLHSIQNWKSRLNDKLTRIQQEKASLISQESALRFLHEGHRSTGVANGTVNDQIEFICSQAYELKAVAERARKFDEPIEELHSRYNHYRSMQTQQQLQKGPTISSALAEDELHDRFKASMGNIKALLS